MQKFKINHTRKNWKDAAINHFKYSYYQILVTLIRTLITDLPLILAYCVYQAIKCVHAVIQWAAAHIIHFIGLPVFGRSCFMFKMQKYTAFNTYTKMMPKMSC